MASHALRTAARACSKPAASTARQSALRDVAPEARRIVDEFIVAVEGIRRFGRLEAVSERSLEAGDVVVEPKRLPRDALELSCGIMARMWPAKASVRCNNVLVRPTTHGTVSEDATLQYAIFDVECLDAPISHAATVLSDALRVPQGAIHTPQGVVSAGSLASTSATVLQLGVDRRLLPGDAATAAAAACVPASRVRIKLAGFSDVVAAPAVTETTALLTNIRSEAAVKDKLALLQRHGFINFVGTESLGVGAWQLFLVAEAVQRERFREALLGLAGANADAWLRCSEDLPREEATWMRELRQLVQRRERSQAPYRSVFFDLVPTDIRSAVAASRSALKWNCAVSALARCRPLEPEDTFSSSPELRRLFGSIPVGGECVHTRRRAHASTKRVVASFRRCADTDGVSILRDFELRRPPTPTDWRVALHARCPALAARSSGKMGLAALQIDVSSDVYPSSFLRELAGLP